MPKSSFAHPVLSCKNAAAHEQCVLRDEAAEWSAMQSAGRSLARAVVRDFRELRAVPDRLRVLALVGKGNNGGDALVACGQLLADYPRSVVVVLLACASDQLKPLAAKAFKEVEGRLRVETVEESESVDAVRERIAGAVGGEGYDLCIDGLLGMAFEPPLRGPARAILEAVNQYGPIGLRAAVDLPSGRGDESDELFFKADFSYATGIAKRTLFEGVAECGRVRYLDFGFFNDGGSEHSHSNELILTERTLDGLRRLRSAAVDKRSFGHLMVVGGSAYMPGALLMAVRAAVSSGVGLITAFAPASVAASLSAQVPEAMWVPWPETANGTLSPRALPLLFDRLDRASAVLVGPGMGQDRNTEMLAMDIVQRTELPVLLDGDALRLRVVEQASKRKRHAGPVVLTPHMGEFMRIAKLKEPDWSKETLLGFCRSNRVVTVLKGSVTRISDGEQVLLNTFGGPVLSRGGSGDLLAGLIGGNLAQDNSSVLTAVARGVVLHGSAAEALARSRGQVTVRTLDVLDYLPEVLRRS